MDVTLKYRDRYRIPSARCEYHAYDSCLFCGVVDHLYCNELKIKHIVKTYT